MQSTAKLRVEQLESRTLLSSGLHTAAAVHQSAKEVNGFLNQNTSASVLIARHGYDGTSYAAVSETFTDFPSFSSFELQKFHTSSNYDLGKLKVPGVELGTGVNNYVFGVVTHGLPGSSGYYVAAFTTTGVETASGGLKINFNGAFLPAGSDWYVVAAVNRSFSANGEWYWDRTLNDNGKVHGQQEYFWNPGGGFGFGTAPIPGSTIFGSAENMAFALRGIPVSGAQQQAQHLNVDLNALHNGFINSGAGLFNNLTHVGSTGSVGQDSSHHDNGVSLDQAYALGLLS